MKFLALSTALVLSGLALSAPAFADRAPNADELATLTERLNELGYQSWKEIELDEDGDDGPHWEVDDARKEDGTVWDLKLSVDKMEVIELDRED
ncbi:PepSY domain-containing protein [Sneathiella sp.]|uniref:PepSY domain-containing protein n=1 Tax=Sneathiella sp. TaxID=1964365 RepID=UPI002FE34081